MANNLFATRLSRKSRGEVFAYMLLAPVLLYILIVMVIPFLWTIYISLTDKKIGMQESFIGLKNYWELLQDRLFWKTLWNTVIFTVFAVAGKVLFGMVMAIVLNKDFRMRGLTRALMILPWAIPTVVSVLTWRWLYSDVGGPINRLLMMSGLIEQQIGFLSTPTIAMASIIVVNIWRGAPFIGISVLAGLQTINNELYEAATIDGANFAQKFFCVTLPSIKNVLMLSTLVTTIWTLNDFEIVWLLTRGGPANATQVVSTMSYTLGFLNLDLGKAVAISIITFPIILLIVRAATKRMLNED